MELVSRGICIGGRSLGLKGFVTSKFVGGLLKYLEVDKSNFSSVILSFRFFLSVSLFYFNFKGNHRAVFGRKLSNYLL